MNEFQATTVMVALFALRCVLPIVLLAAIAYGMKQLVRHWEKEEAAAPRPQPSIALPMAARPERPPKLSIPCWVFNNCDDDTRKRCPAFIHQPALCWLARLAAEGNVPAQCADCPLYTGTPAFAAGD